MVTPILVEVRRAGNTKPESAQLDVSDASSFTLTLSTTTAKTTWAIPRERVVCLDVHLNAGALRVNNQRQIVLTTTSPDTGDEEVVLLHGLSFSAVEQIVAWADGGGLDRPSVKVVQNAVPRWVLQFTPDTYLSQRRLRKVLTATASALRTLLSLVMVVFMVKTLNVLPSFESIVDVEPHGPLLPMCPRDAVEHSTTLSRVGHSRSFLVPSHGQIYRLEKCERVFALDGVTRQPSCRVYALTPADEYLFVPLVRLARFAVHDVTPYALTIPRIDANNLFGLAMWLGLWFSLWVVLAPLVATAIVVVAVWGAQELLATDAVSSALTLVLAVVSAVVTMRRIYSMVMGFIGWASAVDRRRNARWAEQREKKLK